MRRLLWAGTVGLMVVAGAVCAQTVPAAPPVQLVPATPAQAAATGTVIGTVLAQDTQRPARFAQVQMQLVAQQNDNDFGNFSGSVNVRTDLDGTFVAENVAPGDYYITATATGYIAARALLQAQVAAGADPNVLLASLPVVHVTANATSNVTVTMQRGGALAGHVEWEDGSPAAGVAVQAATNGSASAATPVPRVPGFGGGGTPFAQTDDRGNFRMSGLAAGDYVVSAAIQPGNQQGFGRGARAQSPIRVYAPGVFRKAKAIAVSVRAGDERGDVRLVLDLRGLHGVSGAVVSASSGQAIVSGSVTLTDPNDAALQITGAITLTGTFRLPYVPPGSYTLRVAGASTIANGGNGRRGGSTTSGVSFQPFSQALVVGDADVTGVAVTLTPVGS